MQLPELEDEKAVVLLDWDVRWHRHWGTGLGYAEIQFSLL